MHTCIPVHDAILALSGILDTLDEGLLIVTPDNRVACVNRCLQNLLDIDPDTLNGADANRFVRRTLIPRITEESRRVELLDLFSDCPQACDIMCTLSTPGSDGGEGSRVCCSCRVVENGPFQGMRVLRFLPETTGQGQIDEKLWLDNDWYRFLAENLNEGIALVDRKGIVVFTNQRLAEILGCSIDEVTGALCSRFISEEDVECMLDYLENLDTSSHEVFEIGLVHKDGNCIRTMIATTPIADSSGTCLGFLAGFQDITALKQMELQLRESEEKYRSLVESSAETTLIHQNGVITYINPAGVKLLGASDRGEVIGLNILDFIHPDYWDLIRSFISRDLQGEETPLIELSIVRFDGTTILIEGRGTSTFFAGKPAVQTIVRDITHRKQIEERLKASNRHLQLLNRIIGTSTRTQTPDEFLETVLTQTLDLLDCDGGGVYFRESGEDGSVFQYEQGIPEGCREWTGYLLKAPCARTLATGVPHYFEGGDDSDRYTSRILHGLGFAALACIPLIIESDATGALLIGSRDRRSFHPEERALLEAVGREIGAGILRGILYRRLEAANQEANLYLDILTHDIRNADNVTNIYADLLIDELEGDAARHARKLKDGIRKSIEITANVATIRKIRESQVGLVPLDLHDVILEEIAHFPDLSLQYSGMSVEVLADDLLPEIFTNLLGNTVKHGGWGVEVMVAVEDLDEKTVIVTVADTGPGIPDDVKETIFFRFEREGGRRGSQGLGLSICRMLAARYGGKIWVEDRIAGRPEDGASFRLTLRKAEHGEDM